MTVVEDFFVILNDYMATHTSINYPSRPASIQGGVFNCLINNNLVLSDSNIYRLGSIRVSRTVSLFGGK